MFAQTGYEWSSPLSRGVYQTGLGILNPVDNLLANRGLDNTISKNRVYGNYGMLGLEGLEGLEGLGSLGELDLESLAVGGFSGTTVFIALLFGAAYFFSPSANERRARLSEAKSSYRDEVKKIKGDYNRFRQRRS